ncbi:MAG TPA: response regulator transcription factor [Chroococcales cyanobacterium]
MAKILIIEDDKALCATLESWLKFQHHTVECSYNGADGRSLLRDFRFDIVILDLSLPDIQGTEILREFRAQHGQTPILILTGKSDIKDKEAGLDMGADDYLTKPFDVNELGARVRALLRRPVQYVAAILEAGDIRLDPVNHQVTKGGVPLKLFPREFTLLEFLMRHQNTLFSTEALIEHVWESKIGASAETLRTAVRRLRRQIDATGEPSLIENIHGVGYKFSPKSRQPEN